MFITNFAQNAPVKKFRKSVNIWQRYRQKFVAYFWGHPVSRSGWCVCTRRRPKPCCWSTVVSTSTCWSAASWTDHSGSDTSLINCVSVSLLNAEFIDVSSSWTLFHRRQPVMFLLLNIATIWIQIQLFWSSNFYFSFSFCWTNNFLLLI